MWTIFLIRVLIFEKIRTIVHHTEIKEIFPSLRIENCVIQGIVLYSYETCDQEISPIIVCQSETIIICSRYILL